MLEQEKYFTAATIITATTIAAITNNKRLKIVGESTTQTWSMGVILPLLSNVTTTINTTAATDNNTKYPHH